MSDAERAVLRAYRPSAETKASLEYRAGAALAKHFADVIPQFAKQFLLDRMVNAYRGAEVRGEWSPIKVLWDVFFGKDNSGRTTRA